MTDGGTPAKEKISCSLETNDKACWKFKIILDDLELKMAKPKSFIKKEPEKDNKNFKSDLGINIISNNKNSIKDLKDKQQSISKNQSEIKYTT